MKNLKFSSLACLSAVLVAGPVLAASDLNDSQIASIVNTADVGEVSAAKLAMTKSENKDVKAFAGHMMKEHTSNEAQVKALAMKLKIKPESNPTAEALKSEADQKAAQLQNLSGKEFDKAYIDSQVAMHQKVLNDLTNTLIPKADSSQMKSFLETTKSHVQAHLTDAQKIQTALNQ